MSTAMRKGVNLLAAAGLALGAVFGLTGTFVASPRLQATFWTIDAAGLVMAAALLTMKFFRKGSDIVAAGFLVFAIGEGVILSGTAAGLAGSVPSFGGGTALWATGLLLICIPREFATAVRAVGIAAAVLFAVTSARIAWGQQVLPTSSPLPFFAYPFFALTFIGWIWTLLREDRLQESA